MSFNQVFEGVIGHFFLLEVGTLRLELRLTVLDTVMLPLHHIPMGGWEFAFTPLNLSSFLTVLTLCSQKGVKITLEYLLKRGFMGCVYLENEGKHYF